MSVAAGWSAVPLHDICSPKQWPTIKKADFRGSGYPVYGANGVIGRYHSFNHKEPTILIGCRGTCGAVNVSEPEAWVTGNAMALDNLDTSRVDFRFLVHVLRTDVLKGAITGTSQPQITQTSLKRIRIPLPPKSEQRRIAGVLDAAAALRAKRRQALLRLDCLTRSIFVDVFGDPVVNPREWRDDRVLADVAEVRSGITKGRKTGRAQLISVPYLAVVNVQDGFIALDPLKSIDATAVEIEKYSLRRGDILLTEGGDPDKLGRGAVWHGQIEPCIHQNHVFRVRLLDEHMTPEFLSRLLASPRGKRYFLRMAKQTTGIASINMTQLRAFPLLEPPRVLQEKFLSRLSRVQEAEAAFQVSLEQLDRLFASLQQRAFRGEL